MPTDPKQPAPASKSGGMMAVKAELDECQAKFKELRDKADADNVKVQNSVARVEKLKAQWARDRPDEPFDPNEFNPPAKPYEGDQKVATELHELHYKIAELQEQLSRGPRG